MSNDVKKESQSGTTLADRADEGTTNPIPAATRAKLPARLRLAEFALPTLLLILLIIFSIARPSTFPTVANLRGILLTQSVLAILAIGAMFPLIVGDFDLSIAGNLSLGAVVVTILPSEHGWGLTVSIASALVVCTVVGFINGVLVHRLELNAFIVTLATGLVLGGITVVNLK